MEKSEKVTFWVWKPHWPKPIAYRVGDQVSDNQSKTHFVCARQVLFSGYTTFTGGSCINLSWYTTLLMSVLKTLNHREGFSGGWHHFCITYIHRLNCDCASPVASRTLGALYWSKQLLARHCRCFATFILSVNASTGISWQSSSGLWLLMKHCSTAASTEQ